MLDLFFQNDGGSEFTGKPRLHQLGSAASADVDVALLFLESAVVAVFELTRREEGSPNFEAFRNLRVACHSGKIQTCVAFCVWAH